VVFFVLCSYFIGTVAAGTIVTIGSVYLLYSYVMRVTDVFFRFAYQYGDVVQQKTNVLNAESIAKDFEGRKRVSTIRSGMAWKRLIIDHLAFSYHTDTGADLHLEDVSLTIKHGERIALIGESGSGKTTFLKILRGLYTPKKGNISLDRKTLKYGIEMMSEHIALIPQDPEIFSTTIKENITMGVDHSLATIKKFTDMARFTEVVERLPHKWDSSIVEKGVNLSGGEKQRLALARGLMACTDKSIILLDEPTSSIDMKNEAMIYQNIFKTFKDKTVISSIHRLHLLHLFDVIYFFKDGKIIASGSFQELLTSSPPFQTLWEKYQEAQNIQEK
jgi:ABC-type bacteriocin/lantibiotic exporter with double-glycine peptidase domain